MRYAFTSRDSLQTVFIDNTPMFVQIEVGLGMGSVHDVDYESTRAKLASFGLQTQQQAQP
ncbi:MAG: hypothetical protein WBX22_19405 [Silvibacterium sp.]